jgi:methylmalonyl-CoA mutase N-terminal domain/subunit
MAKAIETGLPKMRIEEAAALNKPESIQEKILSLG